MKHLRVFLALGLAFSFAPSVVTMPGTHAFAQFDWGQSGWGNSLTAEEALEARKRGETVSLRKVHKRLERLHGGYHVDTNLFNSEQGQVYVIDWQTGRGERVRFTIDAKSGEILSQR